MNSDAFDCYQDAIMLVEEARIVARKMENDHDDNNDNTESIRIARSLYLRALSIQEALSGWCNEDTARIYYELGWFEYDHAMNYDHALTYLLQALRISNQLYDDGGSGKNDDDCHHPVTMAIFDDIQDLLEDMDLDDLGEEYVNKVFESWEVQDKAEDIVMGRNQDDTRDDPTPHSLDDYRGPSPALILYQKALRKLPHSSSFGIELERAYIYSRMAVLAGDQHEWEDALSYYCSALIRLPNWLQEDHPTIRKIKKDSILLAQQRLTPVCGNNNNHDACRQQMTVMLSIPSLEQLPQVEQNIPESLDQQSQSSTIQTSPSLWLKSYSFPIKAANE